MNITKTLSIFLILIGLLSILYFNKEEFKPRKANFSEKVNLVLRQVGHELLTSNGDTTSRIESVQQLTPQAYLLRINQEFNYGILPLKLDDALKQFEIFDEYYVTVKECTTDTILLGYSFMSIKSGQIACSGREQISTCNDINLVFEDKKSGSSLAIIIPIFFIFGGLGLYVKSNREAELTSPDPEKAQMENDTSIQLGQSSFDFTNLAIEIAGSKAILTYRESKLLQYFVSRPNQVLAREVILSDVWGDEGVIVGRSLDVFVSRLRKILKLDPSLQIKSVHGVGYRLEVSTPGGEV